MKRPVTADLTWNERQINSQDKAAFIQFNSPQIPFLSSGGNPVLDPGGPLDARLGQTRLCFSSLAVFGAAAFFAAEAMSAAFCHLLIEWHPLLSDGSRVIDSLFLFSNSFVRTIHSARDFPAARQEWRDRPPFGGEVAGKTRNCPYPTPIPLEIGWMKVKPWTVSRMEGFPGKANSGFYPRHS
jgi:hypothetical protein